VQPTAIVDGCGVVINLIFGFVVVVAVSVVATLVLGEMVAVDGCSDVILPFFNDVVVAASDSVASVAALVLGWCTNTILGENVSIVTSRSFLLSFIIVVLLLLPPTAVSFFCICLCSCRRVHFAT